jgi:hypothetical protein
MYTDMLSILEISQYKRSSYSTTLIKDTNKAILSAFNQNQLTACWATVARHEWNYNLPSYNVGGVVKLLLLELFWK